MRTENTAASPASETEQEKAKPAEEPSPSPIRDEFDPENLRLSQSFVEATGVKKHLKSIPVRKPNKQDFVRVSRTLRLERAAMIYLEEEREWNLVQPSIAPLIESDMISATLFGAVNRQEVFFFWPIRIPASDGRGNDWLRSQREMAEMAIDAWIRIKANHSLGGYEPFEAENVKVDPAWPDLPLSELLRIAFSRDRYINRPDHPVIARLKGR